MAPNYFLIHFTDRKEIFFGILSPTTTADTAGHIDSIPEKLLPEEDLMGMSLVSADRIVVIGKDKGKRGATLCLFKIL